MASHKPRASAKTLETIVATFSMRANSADLETPETNASSPALGPNPELAPLDRVLTPSNNNNKTHEIQSEEEEKVAITERNYYCICGKELKLYPQDTELSRTINESHDDEIGLYEHHFGAVKNFFDDRRSSLTKKQEQLAHEIINPTNEEDSDEKMDENIDTEQKHEDTTTAIKHEHHEAEDATKREDEIATQIELQQPLSSHETQEVPKTPTNVVSDDASEQNDEEKEYDHLAEESQERQAKEDKVLASTRSLFPVNAKADHEIDIFCHSCDTQLKDENEPRYECDDRNCYKKKHQTKHIQYCRACFEQLDVLLHLERRYEAYIFREDIFEIHTETDRLQREQSYTETSRSRDTDTATKTQSFVNDETPLALAGASGMLSPTNNYTNTGVSPDITPTSSVAGSPEPISPTSVAGSLAGHTKDWYKFNVKYKKMVIDHGDKQYSKEKTKHGDEKEEEDKVILKPTKAVICYPSNEHDSDRVCYIKVEINHLSISEKWETGNAECDVQLTVKLYWMLSEHDYVSYSELKRRNKRKNKLFNQSEIKFTFQPKIDFQSAKGNKENTPEQHVRLLHIKDFFGDEILKNLKINQRRSQQKDYPWYEIRKLMFGYMAEMTYNCEIKIYEPFEIENFPFDCQDIPIIIEPNTFDVLAPAFFDKANRSFITVTGDATNLGRWKMANTISEFINREHNDKNALRIMLKLKRRSSPYLLEHGFLIAMVCFVALSAFTIDAIGDEMKHERLAIVLGLILTLIFIDLPTVPRVTLLHWYFYMSFGFLTFMAMHFAFETYYSPILMRLGDKTCYDYTQFGIGHSDDCAWYQRNNYNWLFFVGFVVWYIAEHIIFIIHSASVNAEENKKLQMNSEKIRKTVEGDQCRIETPARFRSDGNIYRLQYERNGKTDVFGGYPRFDDKDGKDQFGYADRMKLALEVRHHNFNRDHSKIADIVEKTIYLLFLIASFMVLPLTVSILQFVLIEFEECEVEHSFKMEQFAMILCSGTQFILCLLCTLYWFGCCTNACSQFLFWRSMPVLIIVLVGNYVLAIRSYVVYHWEEVECNGYYRDVLYWLFLSWIVLYGLMFSFTFIWISFTKGYVEKRGWLNTADAQVVVLKKREQYHDQMRKQYNIDKYFYIAWEYFGLKMLTTSVPVAIQYPATVVLLILLGDQCHNDTEIITDKQAIALMVLSLILHLVRSLLQGNNSYFFNFTYFITANVASGILSFRALLFAEMFYHNTQCKETVLYHVLWWLMLFWVIHDNLCVAGVVYEIISNYVESFIQAIRAKRGVNFKEFISMIIISVVLVLHLPAFIGQYYMILKNETQSPVQLTSNYCILCIVIVWIQVLIYRLMQTTETLREFVVIPMFIFVSFIFLVTMKSLVFWALVDTTTVTSVLFVIVYGVCILLDVILLTPPTFVIPLVALYAYGGCCKKSGMFRAMMMLLLVFLCVQLPACIIQLVPIWKGEAEKINSWEGELLLLLTWVKLLIEYMYSYLFFDTNRKAQNKVHKDADWEQYKNFIKYLLGAVSSVVSIIAIHCFLFWAKEAFGGVLWWLFIVWIVQYVIYSILPSISIIYYMFFQRDVRRWLNNAYVAYVVFLYVCIQLPGSIGQLYMVEFNKCSNQIGHTLDKSNVESFVILIITFIQIIAFYVITEFLGWLDAITEERKKRDNKDRRMRELAAIKAAAKPFVNYDEWKKKGFSSKEDFKIAVAEAKEEKKQNKWKRRCRKHNGPIFYVAFGLLCAVQFGLVIHSFSYWNTSEKQIDCGCKYNSDPDCDDLYSERKVQLKWVFLIWIIAYVVGLIGGILIAVIRFSGRKWNKRQSRKRKRKRRKNKRAQSGKKAKPKERYQASHKALRTDTKLIEEEPMDVFTV